MDKYEYKLRAHEIVRLAGKKQYSTAAKIADEIRWEKVKNIQMLCMVSEVYEKIGKYDESKEVLLLAYNRSPNGKMIVYKLVDLSIALEDYEEAMEFYHEYMQLAPNDSNALLLKYKLYKGRGAQLETQIAILEEYKSKEYQEEWILELAKLYDQAGQRKECVELCDEIDLWFNDGASVIQALELKKKYEPLTPMQEQKLKKHGKLKSEASSPKTKKKEPALPSGEAKRAIARNSEDPVAQAIIQMTKSVSNKKNGELQKGFSILPKGNVVKNDAEEFAFDLPEGVEQVEIHPTEKTGQTISNQESAESVYEDDADSMEELELSESELTDEDIDKVDEDREPLEDGDLEMLSQQSTDESQEDETAEAPQKSAETRLKEIGKAFSRLLMEDDEMDEDFQDDYIDEGQEDTEEKEDQMVTRGLTGQYEKVVIDDEEDEDDPLNVRLTDTSTQEYEYIYSDEDEEDEYEDIEEQTEDEEEEEEDEPETRNNKRFRFFRNTMEDDELFEDDEEDEEIDLQEEQVQEEPQAPMDEEAILLSYAEKYDTLNLQKELAKSIRQLMDATEKETVDSTLENVKKMVEESHIPELTETMRFKAVRGNMLNRAAKQQAEKLQRAREIEEVISANAANPQGDSDDGIGPAADSTVLKAGARPKPPVELAIKLKPQEEIKEEPLENILTQEDGGQLSIFMPETVCEDEQIEGQMSMEDVLREWEKQELLSENDKEKRALEEARKRALDETQGIMEEIMGLLKDVIPKIGSIKDGEDKMADLAQSLERVQKSLPYTQGIVEAAEESKEAASAIEAACEEAVMELEKIEDSEKENREKEFTEESLVDEDSVDKDVADMVDDIEKKIEQNLPEGMEALLEGVSEEVAQEVDSVQRENWEESAREAYEQANDFEEEYEETVSEAMMAEKFDFTEEHEDATAEYEEPAAEIAIARDYNFWEDEDSDEEEPEEAFSQGDVEGELKEEQILEQDSIQEPDYEDSETAYSQEADYEDGEAALSEEPDYEGGESAYAQEPSYEDGESVYAQEPDYEDGESVYAQEPDYEGSESAYAQEPDYKSDMTEPEVQPLMAEEDEAYVEPAPIMQPQKKEDIPTESYEDTTESPLNDEQKDILSYFLKISSIRPTLERIVKQTEYAPEHMIITGASGNGKKSLAMRIVKASQVNQEDKIETIAKIKASLLNQKKVAEILEKVNDGVLIIENAGSLKPSTVYAIEDALYSNKYYVQIVLVDTKSEISKLLKMTQSFLNDIQMRIDIPTLNNNELVEYAKTYADMYGYSFDGMAVLALHSAIDLRQTEEHAANLEDVQKIMDEAMANADKRSKKLIGKLFGKKHEGTLLIENDFE